jgi:putative peptidoglycan lipid II flippase
MGLMGPAVFGVSIAQINFLVDTFIASFLQPGSISWLYYADRLMEFPLAIFGIALGTVILPTLSRHHAKGDAEMFSATMDFALRNVLTATIPAAVGLCVLAEPLMSTLFQYGKFDSHDAEMAAAALRAYAFGLTGFIMVKVLAPGFYAREDTRTPVRVGLIAMVANLIGCLALSGLFEHAGLALATSIAAFVNGGLLLRQLIRMEAYRPLPGWWGHALRVGGASLLMGLTLGFATTFVDNWGAYSLLPRASLLGCFVLGGVAIYGVAARLSGLQISDMAHAEARL